MTDTPHKDVFLMEEVIECIAAIRRAFGAPGNYGYESDEGRALYALYLLSPKLVSYVIEVRDSAPEVRE